MSNILIIYSTTDGHTLEICQHLKRIIENSTIHNSPDYVEVVNLKHVSNINLLNFDKIVIGASIRYGKHQSLVSQFIKSYKSTLERKPSAFFTVNVVARKPGKNQPDTNPYLIKFLKQTSWQPNKLGVFAGKIDYPRYGFWDRLIIRFIMWLTHGPTDPMTVIDYTDWDQVDEFARGIIDI